MENFDIKDLEELSNIKAHTIRIWEKRYGLLEPTRTSTNIRKYDSGQLKKLLNISLLLNKGFKISEVAKMSESEMTDILLDESKKNQPNLEDHFITEMIGSMMNFDTQGFEKTLNNVILRYGLLDAILKVVYPFLQKTGVLWSTNNIMPAQEHLTVNILRQKIITAIDGVALNTTKDSEFILFLPPNEYHEIGLLLSHYIILKQGYKCYYLGQNVPYDNVKSTLSELKQPKVLTFLMDRNHNSEFKGFIEEHKLNELLIISTEQIISSIKPYKSHKYIKNPDDLLKCL